jgi:hypothetical protein
MQGITQTWKIIRLEVFPVLGQLTNLVTMIEWALVTDASALGGQRHVAFGQTNLGLPDDTSYTPLDNVTESQAMAWIQQALGVAKLEEIKGDAAQFVLSTLSTAGTQTVTNLSWITSEFSDVIASPPVPLSPDEQLSLAIRNGRNQLLVASDWTQLPDVPNTTRELWAIYRQQLRDLPQQAGFPQQVTWPQAPQ